jgi:hypothetical protein
MRLIVTPGTIVRWHRGIVRRRWARRSRLGRCGRPAAHRKVRSEVLRLARENESYLHASRQARAASLTQSAARLPGAADQRLTTGISGRAADLFPG